jgi:catechol 2,3-dioxygenase-like lactoylglutathione lyase family enzyme
MYSEAFTFSLHVKETFRPVTSVYPVLMSRDVAAAASFYRDLLGFEATFESDWYISLRHDAFELAVLADDHQTIPEGYRAIPQGVIVNLEVDDVDSLHARLADNPRAEIVLPLRDEDFGQRHFIVVAPDGVLLDVIQPVPPGPTITSLTRASMGWPKNGRSRAQRPPGSLLSSPHSNEMPASA